jgi:hypothetical protein
MVGNLNLIIGNKTMPAKVIGGHFGWNLNAEPKPDPIEQSEFEEPRPPKPNPELEKRHRNLLTQLGQAAAFAAKDGEESFYFLAYWVGFVMDQGFQVLCELHGDDDPEADDGD